MLRNDKKIRIEAKAALSRTLASPCRSRNILFIAEIKQEKQAGTAK